MAWAQARVQPEDQHGCQHGSNPGCVHHPQEQGDLGHHLRHQTRKMQKLDFYKLFRFYRFWTGNSFRFDIDIRSVESD